MLLELGATLPLSEPADPESKLSQKAAGAYYTPDEVASSLVRWVVRDPLDRLLDPSCGDGRFIRLHRNSVGCEQDELAVREARQRAPHASIEHIDFFAWASTIGDRFTCAAGNPPFIRYQTFKGEARERALRLCEEHGASFTGLLTSSWAPFLVVAASLLVQGGRMGFVVPAEIGHAPLCGTSPGVSDPQFWCCSHRSLPSKAVP
jgi:adenine-specific DNA methylase